MTAKRPKGDRGGNEFEIITSRSDVKNLHSFWDAGLNQIKDISSPLTEEHMKYLQDLVEEIQQEWPRDKFEEELKDHSPKNWSLEGAKITSETVYKNIEENE